MYDLLIGALGETRETVRETVELMRKIDADCVGLSMGVRLYKGTAMADWVQKQGDMASNPDIYGIKKDNIDLLRPVFYVAPEFGADIAHVVRDIVGDDPRFFLPYDENEHENYNYNDNTPLVDAIQNGARGAYWDILRKLR